MNREEQIRTVHAAFINDVVRAILQPLSTPDFQTLMRAARDSGWIDLAKTLEKVKGGRRDIELLNPLDEEDSVIAEAILRGLQDPSTLPDPNAKPDPALAAPGLASMIHAAASGNPQALHLISNMAEQMSRAGGSMARLAAVIRPLINGERDPDKLIAKLDSGSEAIVLGILKELKQLEER